MALTKLQFKPGINKELTSYSNEGGWNDCDKVRFRSGYPEKIGGWTKIGNNSFLGACRALHPWQTLSLDKFIGVGTNAKYYIESGQAYYDITPLRLTITLSNNPFACSNNSNEITVTHANHNAISGDFVSFSGAATLGSTNITDVILNQEYRINEIVDSNTYKIIARNVSSVSSITVDGTYTPSPVVANGTVANGGGASVVAKYQLSAGLNTGVGGNGWGAGTWGRLTWGSAATITTTSVLRLWSHDNFGEDLIINVRNAGIYYWDKTNGLTARAVELNTLANSDLAPTIATQVMVSDRDRHILAFGCDPESNIGTQDPLLIRFSSQESLTDWRTQATNTAGELRLGSGSEIVCAVETRQQVLVFTDTSLYTLQFLGPPITFGIQLISENLSIRSPFAAIAVEDTVFWMGLNEFYVYTGAVQKLPCTVKDFIFNDLNSSQAEKIFAAANAGFSEVWWFYPSASSDEIDKYVVFNYQQKIWYVGSLNRTAWMDRGVNELPIAASTDGYLYNHETGDDDGSTNPASAITAHIESSQIDIGDGDKFSFISRLIPDITFRNSAIGKQAIMTVKTRNAPGGQYLQTEDSTVEKSASVPVEQFTQDARVRLRGRSFALRVSSSQKGVGWRLGSPRLDIRPDGRR
jgi:hypothetical protein|tara:strand:- start:3391 stop:5304 length:1914 start_codon:yes stop_codon:yes gene_type:complete